MNADLKIAGAVERHFAHQNVSFDFHLILEDRKTVAVSVLPSQATVVKAPLEASDERIEEFLRKKVRWVLRQKRYFGQFKVPPEKKYISGETFRYRGRCYKLLIRKNEHDEHVSLQHGTLTVFTASPTHPSHSKALLDAWYLEKAHKVLSERLSVCSSIFGYSKVPGLMIRRMTRRWGSYSQKTNRVILNQELVKAATRQIDYVIIHELCHVTHKQHSRAFYDLLASRSPQWQRLKTELEISLLG